MTAIAEELDRRMRELDPQQAARCEQLIRTVLDSIVVQNLESKPQREFITRTHDFQFPPSLDLTKLGQLADES
jgi:hypothetical protein